LDERRRRLKAPARSARRARLLTFLESKFCPTIPADQLGRRLSRSEEDELFGYGPGGV
jgi:hypothetical protein